jgi:hypothetical protein
MNRAGATMLAGVAGVALAGCAAAPATILTPEQVAAIQTRDVEASPDRAFRAAAAVMLDRGMVIAMSDFNAGLLGAGAWGYAAGVGRAELRPGSGLVVWMRPAGPARTTMRVKFAAGDSEEATSRFVEQVERRLLASAEARRPAP